MLTKHIFLGLVPLLTEDTGKTLTDFNKISPRMMKEVFCEGWFFYLKNLLFSKNSFRTQS